MRSGNLRAVLRRLRHDWPGKVGAVVVAAVLWWIASGDPGVTVQRSVLVPLQVTGAEADEVAVGVPARVEVVITGPSDRMDRLDADDVDAVLELADVDGEFSREIDARVPQTLRVVRVVPAEVIGRLEAVRSRSFPLVTRVAPARDGNVPVSLSVAPARATVEARDPVLERVSSVWAVVGTSTAGEHQVALVPVDADGRPVAEARVVPETATVTVVTEARLVRATRPVAVANPNLPGVTIESVRPDQVDLVGTPEALAQIEVVRGRVPDATSSLLTGRYDLPLRLEVPSGIAVRGVPVVSIRVRSIEPSGDTLPTP